MCSKIGIDEIDTVANLMGLSICAVVSDVLDTDIGDLELESHLTADLGLTADRQAELDTAIQEYFDGFQADFSSIKTIQDLVDQVVEGELYSLAA